MANFQNNNFNMNEWNSQGNTTSSTDVAVKAFMTNVFSWMFGALLITALTAFGFSHLPALMELLYKTQDGIIVGFTPLAFICMFAPFAFILVINLGFNRLSTTAMMGAFLLFAAVMGMSMSTIFFRYNIEVIGASFAITAGMFGTMAVMGYTTKTDLSKFGSIMIMGFIGIFIASVVNIFMHSSGLGYLISFGGVAVFTGLTAWDVQKLKNIAANVSQEGEATASKLAIWGALNLYMDFINLFYFILSLMGGGNRR
jgi:FtsH-binding integral membrane protein